MLSRREDHLVGMWFQSNEQIKDADLKETFGCVSLVKGATGKVFQAEL